MVCNCVFGGARKGNALLPGRVAPIAPPCRNSRSLFTIHVIMMSMTLELIVRPPHLPQGADWLYEIKLDGYRALAIKSGGKVQLRSRNDNDFTERYSIPR